MFLSHPAIATLGWSLLHFLWQGLLVGFLTALLLRFLRRASSQARHWAACGGLFLCLAFFGGTLAYLWPESVNPVPVVHVVDQPKAIANPGETRIQRPSMQERIERILRPTLPWIVSAWLTGSLLLLLRLAGGWIWLQRLRSRLAVPAPPEWKTRLARLAECMGLSRCPELKLCDQAEGPLAHGWWRPAILMPASLLTGLNPDLLEALLAHELAHIRRQDYLANLLQSLCETLLFFHPAVWWISAKIRATREEVCDDLAAMAIGEPRRLALALAELDLFQLPFHASGLAPGAHQGDLMNRIQRLLNPQPPRPLFGSVLSALLAAALLSPLLAHGEPMKGVSSVTKPVLRAPELIQQIDTLAKREGIDPQLLRSMAEAESGFDPTARSPRGAMGLLQVMPQTALKYGAKNLEDPEDVMKAGARYLRSLLDRYKGDRSKAVAAYNCGEEALDSGKITEEASRYRDKVLMLLESKAVQPASIETSATTTITNKIETSRVSKNLPREVILSRHGNRIRVHIELTRTELTQILAENWNWLFVKDAPDQELKRSFPALQGADHKKAVDIRLKDVGPESFLQCLGKMGCMPAPMSEAWLKQLPPAMVSGELKRLTSGEWDVRMQVLSLGGFEVEIRSEGIEKPLARVVAGQQEPNTEVLRQLSMPRIRTEATRTKAMSIRIFERGTGRWGEVTLDTSGETASFSILLDRVSGT